MSSTYLVTGAAGFIGSNFLDILVADQEDKRVVVLDKLTYCGNIMSIRHLIDSGRIEFVKGDIADRELVASLLARYEPQYVINFAAESHVDRSVDDPTPFIKSNFEGVFNLLECCRRQRSAQLASKAEPTLKKYVQISTDEVYGDLEVYAPRRGREDEAAQLGRDYEMYGEDAFTENYPLKGSSPYSASKASADLLTLSYYRSFGLPVTITRCSNNYGPRQFPEKLIPLVINNILNGKALPVYGQGTNVRDWIHVDDHARGILAAARHGKPGEVYNFGGYSEKQNIDIVKSLISIVKDAAAEMPSVAAAYPAALDASDSLITYVTDRPGHDRRYAIDALKAMTTLGWRPLVRFDDGLASTVRWYLENLNWVKSIVDGDYRDYYEHMYANR